MSKELDNITNAVEASTGVLELKINELVRASKVVLARLSYQNCVGHVTRTTETAKEREDLFVALSKITGDTELALQHEIGAMTQDHQIEEEAHNVQNEVFASSKFSSQASH